MSLIQPVILSGGSGTRLWPISRPARPKQFHKMLGPKTMLQLTLDRVRGSDFAPSIVVANEVHADEVEKQLAATGVDEMKLILEPVGRNTALAIALAALQAGDDATLLVLPSDHLIRDTASFHAAIKKGVDAVEAGLLVTFGVQPDRPETGYGYIHRGSALADGIFEAARFVEKPDHGTAARYLAEGGYYWNAGIFLFSVRSLLDQLELHAPDILGQARAAFGAARVVGGRLYPARQAVESARAVSIDEAVLEHSGRIAVIPVDMGWSDLGSWDALYDVSSPDAEGNIISGRVLARDTRNSLVRSDGPMLVAVGIEDLVVVATSDAVLIMPRGQTQQIKEIVDTLRQAGHAEVC